MTVLPFFLKSMIEEPQEPMLIKRR